MTAADKALLKSAIERLYAVFGDYRPPTTPTYCHRCVNDDEDRVLRVKPLRELNADELERYWLKPISTWGTVEQFKYLLPRLFEAVVFDGHIYCPELLFEKPRLAGLNRWPGEEQAALNSYCDALWRYALAHHPLSNSLPSFASIDNCLCSIAQIADDLSPVLNLWDSDRTSAATSHLVDFAAKNVWYLAGNLGVPLLENDFWGDSYAQMQQVVDWLLTRDFAGVFDVATATTSSADLRDELTRAIVRRSARDSLT